MKLKINVTLLKPRRNGGESEPGVQSGFVSNDSFSVSIFTLEVPKFMRYLALLRAALVGSLILGGGLTVLAQTTKEQTEFGPVVSAYLGYLRNEQEVVDDRASRREINVAYYRRNSNRIRALRQMAVQIARETHNDYLPELEAVAGDELRLIFERPPRFETLKVGEVIQTTFRYLGVVRSGDLFYVFARLDPYEQADLLQKSKMQQQNAAHSAPPDAVSGTKDTVRARRVTTP